MALVPLRFLSENQAMSNARLVAASQDRLRNLRRQIRQAGTAAYLAADPVEVSYLSNFGGDDSYLLVPARGRPTLITDFRYAEDAAVDSPHVSLRLRKGTLVAEVSRLAKRLSGSLAFNPDLLTCAARKRLVEQLGAGGVKELPGVVSRLRMHKDATEVAAITRALAITQAAYADFLKRIRVGMTETRLAAELEYAFRCHGADGPAYPTICAIGPNASRPHARPGSRPLRADSLLLIDFGAKVAGYCCDLTRMVFLTRIRPEVRRAYQAVLEAQQAAIAVAAPGVRAVEVDAAARNVLNHYGYGSAFGHGTGHGFGREIHEPPAVSPKAADLVLEPGMVITIEPGVYLPGRFGIRIEDDLLITAQGRRVLSSLPKALDDVLLKI
jgi:Xaa-Pro aminopeptidase